MDLNSDDNHRNSNRELALKKPPKVKRINIQNKKCIVCHNQQIDLKKWQHQNKGDIDQNKKEDMLTNINMNTTTNKLHESFTWKQ